MADPILGRGESGIPVSPASVKQFELGGIFPEQEENFRICVEPKFESCSDDCEQVAHSADRSICDLLKRKSSGLLFPKQRGSGKGSRCYGPALGLPFVVGFSPLSVNTAGPQKVSGRVHKPNTCIPLLAQKDMVLDTSEYGDRTSLGVTSVGRSTKSWAPPSSKHKPGQASSLVSEEQILKKRGLSDK